MAQASRPVQFGGGRSLTTSRGFFGGGTRAVSSALVARRAEDPEVGWVARASLGIGHDVIDVQAHTRLAGLSSAAAAGVAVAFENGPANLRGQPLAGLPWKGGQELFVGDLG